MSLDIGAAISSGIERSVKRNGLVLMAVFAAIAAVSAVFTGDLTAALMQRFLESRPLPSGATASPMGPTGVAAPVLGLSIPAAALGYLLAQVVSMVASIAAIRTFVSDETERVPQEFLTRNLLWVAGNVIVGSIVFGVMVAIGFVLFIIPGVFLLVSLYYWNFVVITEDENFITGLQRSWALTEDNRIMLFILGTVVTIAVSIISLISGQVASIAPQPGGVIIPAVVSAPFGVVSVAIAAQAFRQLREMDIKSPGDDVEAL